MQERAPVQPNAMRARGVREAPCPGNLLDMHFFFQFAMVPSSRLLSIALVISTASFRHRLYRTVTCNALHFLVFT